MSKRSDFAQKLLDDLRLRKERMAASHSSDSSKLLAGEDAYAYSKKRHSGGSANLKTGDKTSFRSVDTRSRSIVKEEASMQIVPFRRGQHSQLIGDILNSTVLSFMKQITRRSVESGTRQRKTSNRTDLSLTSHFPVLSQLHITEVSKGAEKLNRILKAYSSNGLCFDNHSMEIGKELLKGAIDLEESLRMLVRLEEAEKYMITPHRKNKIMLLEDKDNDTDNRHKIAEQIKVNQPRFSFDEPSRNRHSQSASYVSDVRTLSVHSQQTNYSSSISKTEKGIIPNVIAKLMGLDELPENDESKYTEKKTSIPEQRIEGIISIAMPQSAKYLNQWATSVNQKQINGSQLTQFQKSLLAHKKEKSPAIQRAGFEVTLENVNAERGSYKAEVRKEDRQRSINQPSNISNRRKEMHENDNGLNNSKFGPQKSVEKNEENEPVLKHDLRKMAPQTHKRSKTNLSSHMEMGFKESTPMEEVIDAGKIWANSQEGETKNQRIGKLKKSRLNFKKTIPTMHTDMNLQKQDPHPKKATHNRKGSIDKMQSERCEKGRPNEDQVGEKHSIKYSNDKRGFVNRNSIPDESTSYINLDFKNKKTSNQQVMEVKAIRASDNEKVKVPKMDEHETHRMVEKVTTERNASLHNIERLVEHKTSTLLNIKQGRHDKFIGAKEAIQMNISKSKNAGAGLRKLNNSLPILRPTTVQENLPIQENQASLLHSPVKDECPNQMELQVEASYESDQRKILVLTNDGKDHTVSFRSNEDLKAHERTSDAFDGTRAREKSNFQHQKHLKSAKLAQLTENETYLKQTLVRSQLFLDTAEALFKLTIPHGTFHGCGFNHHDNDIKLIIDCGYEVMKRKGKRQELLTMSMSFITVTSLDELVKELYMDLEKMKRYGGVGNKECGIEDCLREMLAIDVMNSDPDTNCMWDSGWNDVIFAILDKDGIVKEVEKYVINGLLDEMIRDLLRA